MQVAIGEPPTASANHRFNSGGASRNQRITYNLSNSRNTILVNAIVIAYGVTEDAPSSETNSNPSIVAVDDIAIAIQMNDLVDRRAVPHYITSQTGI